MPDIQVLDQITIDKIAAGEVVERPSSVVKELCENAIDAGAHAITVEIRDGGTSLIRVTDDGCGMDKENVRKAFLRHSTSKLRSISDLLNISSLGFRGEALSSISAVAQVELMTKTADALTGIRYTIEGGVEGKMEDAGLPNGTTILVKNLFYNTPARRKFLKSNQTEGQYILSLTEHLALSHAEIRFRCILNGQTKLETSGNGKVSDVIYQIYGRDITKNLLEVSATDSNYRVSGFIGKPMIARGNRSYESWFVNGRYVSDRLISKAVEESYKKYLMNHQFPFAVLFIETAGNLVDVNVHPTKANVRFSKEEEIYQFLKTQIDETLDQKEFIPEIVSSGTGVAPSGASKTISMTSIALQPEPKQQIKAEISGTHVEPFEVQYRKKEEAVFSTPKESLPLREEVSVPLIQTEPAPAPATHKNAAQKPVQQTLPIPPTESARFRLIGQAFDTYWILEYDGKMYLVDQHAAHEKINYERMVKKFRAKTFTSQRITPPIIVRLSPEEQDLVSNHPELFSEFGFEIEPFGGKEYAIYSVPSDVYGMKEDVFFRELLDEFRTETIQGEDPDLLLHKLATAACKASIKGGDRISFAEAEVLLKELFTLENPYNCPHGRPTMISFTETEIEKLFKRIV